MCLRCFLNLRMLVFDLDISIVPMDQFEEDMMPEDCTN